MSPSILATAVLTLICSIAIASSVEAQSASPADIARKLTGSWKLNVELTPTAVKPGRGRGAASRAPLFAVAGVAAQRGGRGGGGSGGGGQPGSESAPLMAEEVAAQAALTVLHEVPVQIAIEASADAVTFREPRGEWHFKIDGKNASMDVPGGTLHSKSKWEKGVLRQEFSSAQRKLVKSWSIDLNDRLVLTEKVESFAANSESKAVFDRQ